MCGIAGYFSTSSLSEQPAQNMVDTLSHRGPDSHGIVSIPDDGIVLLHTRLAIVDLSDAGHQPMRSAGGRYVITYNGEIYNHQAIRDELAVAGYVVKWRGHSDTETLLAAIECWGLTDTLRKVDGMFALALWDKAEKVLSLARDRLGEKPLYYGWQAGHFLFGSELKALRAHPAFSGTIDTDALTSYFRYRYIPAPHSVYQGIFKIAPATLLQLDTRQLTRESLADSHTSVARYWTLPLVRQADGSVSEDSIREREAIERLDDTAVIDLLESRLISSVAQQSLADVPLGAFLSGGVDSSAIVALMQSVSSTPVNTFSIGFQEATFDEAVHACKIARHLGTNHEELYVSSQDALSVIPALSSMYDEPFADSSQIPMHLVASMARSHVTVALSGDAGDELFGGYNRYRYAANAWSKLSRVPRPVRTLVGSSLRAMHAERLDSGHLHRLMSRIGVKLPTLLGAKVLKVADGLNSRCLDDLYRRLVSEWQCPQSLVMGGREKTDWTTQMPSDACDLSPVRWMMMQDMLGYLPGDILTKVDRASMHVSLETRVPFLGRDVIELAALLPERFLVRDGISKWCLRQVLNRYVPTTLVDRPKAGFALPMATWLRGPLDEWAGDLLNSESLRRDGILDSSVVHQAWDQHQRGIADRDSELWTILMFQSWKQANDG